MVMCASSLNQLFFSLFLEIFPITLSVALEWLMLCSLWHVIHRSGYVGSTLHTIQQEGGTRNLTGSGCYLDVFCIPMMPDATWQRFFTLIYVVKGKRDVSAAVNSQL